MADLATARPLSGPAFASRRAAAVEDPMIDCPGCGHLAGMTNRHLLYISVAVFGCGDAALQEAGEPDEANALQAVEADTVAPVIKSVLTDDGFRQIRQNSLSHLVIRGNQLDTATSVTLGALPLPIESITAHEIRA